MMATTGDPQPCRCGNYHIIETANSIAHVPCPYGWDNIPLAFSWEHHCPGCRCNEKEEIDGTDN